jgi:glycosyltransferase involved in cell wall biosynthesis
VKAIRTAAERRGSIDSIQFARMTRASVIVPARNAEATLPRTLEALASQELDEPYEVIVVDDGSSDATVTLARSAPGGVKVLEQSALGPAQARNRGVAEAQGSALAFCDADVFPTPGWLAAGLSALDSVDVVQGHVLPDPSSPVGPFDRTLWVTFEVGLYETANLFVRRDTFERTGGFEEWFRPEIGKAMAEDVWFGWKARRLGARTAFCADALAYHAVFRRRAREYIAERRRLRYFPLMAAKMPELRRHFLFARVFLNRRSAALDLGIAGTIVALALRSPTPLLAGAPYGRLLWRRARGFGPAWPKVAAVDLAADLVGLEALVRGSVRARSPLL